MLLWKRIAPFGALVGSALLCASMCQAEASELAPKHAFNQFGSYFELGAMPICPTGYARGGYIFGSPASNWLLDAGLSVYGSPYRGEGYPAAPLGASFALNPRYIVGDWTLGPEIGVGYSHLLGHPVADGFAYGTIGLRGTYQIHHRGSSDSALTFGVYLMPVAAPHVKLIGWVTTPGEGESTFRFNRPYVSIGYMF